MAREGRIATCLHCRRTEVIEDHHEGEQWWCSIYCYEEWVEEAPYRRG